MKSDVNQAAWDEYFNNSNDAMVGDLKRLGWKLTIAPNIWKSPSGALWAGTAQAWSIATRKKSL